MSTQRRRHCSQLLCVGFLSFLAVHCGWGEAYTQAKQNRTVADLSMIVHRIEGADSANDHAIIAKALEESEVRVDSWGHPFLYATQGTSYVLVAVGRDGALDVDRIEEYFQVEPGKNIRGKPDEDIVYRDGKLLSIVGK